MLREVYQTLSLLIKFYQVFQYLGTENGTNGTGPPDKFS